MALTFTGTTTWDTDRFVLKIETFDGDKRVACAVSSEALMDRGRSKDGSIASLLALYDAFKAEIQAIAQRKYAAGTKEADGLVLVRTADLNR
ncbi:DUF1488 family protein [Dongia sp.]|uniref:DUF1488 family protein n=1 Tax=Dongia sp. TaxID=1977262 RepID=UPI0035AD93BA